jgi:DNA polymerase-1
MDPKLNYKGMLKGLEIMTKNIDDTKLITYLATNTTAGNKLSLKQTAQEFAGDYAQEEIKDITLIQKTDLLRYNLIDALSTWYTRNKNYPIMVQDNQEEIYKNIFIPSMKVIIQMELVGLPIDRKKVDAVAGELLDYKEAYLTNIKQSSLIKQFENILRAEALIDKNAKLKKKVMHADDFLDLDYNPASNNQTRYLLYDIFEFEVVDTTDSGAPAVGAGTLKKLLNKLIHKHNITEEELNDFHPNHGT